MDAFEWQFQVSPYTFVHTYECTGYVQGHPQGTRTYVRTNEEGLLLFVHLPIDSNFSLPRTAATNIRTYVRIHAKHCWQNERHEFRHTAVCTYAHTVCVQSLSKLPQLRKYVHVCWYRMENTSLRHDFTQSRHTLGTLSHISKGKATLFTCNPHLAPTSSFKLVTRITRPCF